MMDSDTERLTMSFCIYDPFDRISLLALDSLNLAILISILRAEEKEKCQYRDIRRYFY